MNTYEIHRTKSRSGRRFMYYPTVNGKRLSKTNFARKYDARGLLRRAVALYGEERLLEMSKTAH